MVALPVLVVMVVVVVVGFGFGLRACGACSVQNELLFACRRQLLMYVRGNTCVNVKFWLE